MKNFSIISITEKEPVQPFTSFTMVKYFTYASVILMLIGTFFLVMLNTHWTRKILLKKNEAYANLLIENLNHQIFMQFIVPTAIKHGRIQLRDEDQFARMDTIVRNTLHSFDVAMVNLYDKNNTVSYSFDMDRLGKKSIFSAPYENAARGNRTTTLIQQGSFWQLFFGSPQKTQLVTIAPLRAEKAFSALSGPVLGVVEIVQNVSDDYRTSLYFQLMTLSSSTVVMAILFFILRQIVKHGEKTIKNRTSEQMRLKEELAIARHLSAIGEMTAGISHEIRNPLGIIRSTAELLSKKLQPMPQMHQLSEIIYEEACRMNEIISDFLSFASPRKPDKRPLQISGIIDKTIDFLSPYMIKNGIAPSTSVEPDLPDISADSNMIYQALLNIAMNAIQAMENQGTMNVHAYRSGPVIVIRIGDTGPGIPESKMQSIWDPFFTTKDTGTGLGLGIVKNIIEAHNGKIQIQNRSTGGAEVTIELPIR